MITRRLLWGTWVAAPMLAACPTQPPAPTSAPAPAAASQPAASERTAIDELNELDPRQPVPLQPMMAWHQKQNMKMHLEVVERITTALAQEDFDAVAKASAQIEPSASMTQTCQHMGAGAEGFTPMALEFHERARAIGEAARAKDSQKVLAALGKTLQSCTGCHATYRQDVVTAAVWQERTGQPSPLHQR